MGSPVPNAGSLKRARLGWCGYDWANSAFATVMLSAVLPVYFVSLVPPEGAKLPLAAPGHFTPASALWGYAVSLSMLLVAITAPWLGTLTDRKGWRLKLLSLFCLLGATATCLLYFATSGHYLPAAALFVVANVGFAAGNIFYNAFLPVLAEGCDLDRLSARGFALGYIGGGLMLAIGFAMIQFHGWFGLVDKAEASRLCFLLTGLWWGGFSIPCFLSLRGYSAPNPALGTSTSYLKTFSDICKHRDLLVFLIAFLFYNDGIQTVIAVSAIFATEELSMAAGSVLGVFLMIQFIAMPGSLVFGRLAERWSAKASVLLSLVLFMGITLYAYVMDSAYEFWILGVLVALILGGSQAISRSLFASMVPKGKDSEFFAFYAISGKFASIFGPLVFAVIADITGSTRLSLLGLNVFFLTGIILLLGVNVGRGRNLAMQEAGE